MAEPSVSVLTACTRPELLAGLYATIVAQLDGVVLDDAGIGADPRVHVHGSARAMGSAVSRNTALLRARAPHVLCVDDDDLLAPGALAPLLDGLEREPDCFCAWGGALTFQ